MSDPVDREIADHCRAFQALKGVGRQRGCDGCEAGEDECWGHYCATVLAPKHGIRPHWNLRFVAVSASWVQGTIRFQTTNAALDRAKELVANGWNWGWGKND